METKISPHEVMEEEEPLDLNKKITTALVKQNVTTAVIDQLSTRYGSLRLKDLNDKESYLELKAAAREVGKVRILTEKICKKGREEAIAIQKLWLAKEKEVKGELAAIEDPLREDMEKFENEQHRIELEEIRQREHTFNSRIVQIMKCGAQFTGETYKLNEIEYDITNIRDAHTEVWDELMYPKYKAEFDRMEAIRLEEKRKVDDAAVKLKEEQEKFDNEQREFRKQQQEFANRQAELDRKEQAIKDDQLRQQQQIIHERGLQLEKLGMVYDHGGFYKILSEDGKSSANILREALSDLGKDDWNKLVSSLSPQIEAILQERKEKAVAEMIASSQKKRDAELAEENKRKAEELLTANDKTKWTNIVQQLESLTIPEMKSPMYQKKVRVLVAAITSIKNL